MIVLSSSNVQEQGISPKILDVLRASQVVDRVSMVSRAPLTKTASVGAANDLVVVLAKVLSDMNLTTSVDIGDLFKRLLAAGSLEKTADTKKGSRQESVLIASKEIKDSHYQVDVAKDFIEREGKSMFMVSVYARESYLGRYLVKRNYFFLPDNEKGADEAFEEVCSKMAKIKSAYHSGKINIKSVTSEMLRVVQGVLSDISFKEENDIGTTVKRN
jgi:hypothetical protein